MRDAHPAVLDSDDKQRAHTTVHTPRLTIDAALRLRALVVVAARR